MATVVFARRALVAFAALAAGVLSGCNTTQTAAVQSGAAASNIRISNIEISTAPLLAQSGNLTAQWVQQTLPGALAQAFSANVAPGDPDGATLSVRVDSIYLGEGGPADPDAMKGVATLSGPAARQTKLQATSTYISSPVDQTLVDQAMQGRVQALSQSFAYWLKRKWRL